MIAVWCAKCRKRVDRFSATAVEVRAWCHGETELAGGLSGMAVDNKSQLATLTMFKEPKQPLTDAPRCDKIKTGRGEGGKLTKFEKGWG